LSIGQYSVSICGHKSACDHYHYIIITFVASESRFLTTNNLRRRNTNLTLMMTDGDYIMTTKYTVSQKTPTQASVHNRHHFPLLGRPEQPFRTGLCFTRDVIFLRHSFSEVRRPIALKLCHMVGIWCNFITPLQKFEGLSPKKISSSSS